LPACTQNPSKALQKKQLKTWHENCIKPASVLTDKNLKVFWSHKMKKFVIMMVFALALLTSAASANQELLEIWADIRVLEFDKAYIDGFYEVTDIYGEIVLLGHYDENNAEHQKAVSYLIRNSDQIKMGVFCSNTQQEKLHQAFLSTGASKPEKLHVKLSVWVNANGKTLVSIVDHNL